jgi:hypothetical protein
VSCFLTVVEVNNPFATSFLPVVGKKADILQTVHRTVYIFGVFYSTFGALITLWIMITYTGDHKESFYIGPDLNQWPSEGTYLLCYLLRTDTCASGIWTSLMSPDVLFVSFIFLSMRNIWFYISAEILPSWKHTMKLYQTAAL